jgi:hypothetical protein
LKALNIIEVLLAHPVALFDHKKKKGLRAERLGGEHLP